MRFPPTPLTRHRRGEPPSVLGEAVLDAVIPRRPPKDYRPKRPEQPANTFVNRSGELASAAVAPLTPVGRGRGEEEFSGIAKNDDQKEVEVPNERPRC